MNEATFPLTRQEFDDLKAQYLRAFGKEQPKPQQERDTGPEATRRLMAEWGIKR